MAAKTGLLGVAAAQTDKYKKRVGVMAGLGIGTSITDRNTTITIKSSPPKSLSGAGRAGRSAHPGGASSVDAAGMGTQSHS